MRVLLVDDQRLFRAGVRALLEQHGIAVVAEAETGEEAIALCGLLAPDVVLLDLELRGISGIETVRRLAALRRRVPAVVLTRSCEQEDVLAALRAGARGYLLKDAPGEEVARAVGAAAVGDVLLCPRANATLVGHLRNGSVHDAAEERDLGLSQREQEVLRLVADGRDNGQIAERLGISRCTVKNHVSHILAKLGVSNRTEAGIYAVRTGHA